MGRRSRAGGQAWRAGLRLVTTATLAGAILTGHQLVPAGAVSETPVAAALSSERLPEPTSPPTPDPAALAEPADVIPSCGPNAGSVELAVKLRGNGHRVCLPFSTDARVASRIDPVYTSVATAVIQQVSDHTELAQTPGAVTVCWSKQEWERLGELFAESDFVLGGVFGFVSAPHPVINLSPGTCRHLDQLTYEDTRFDFIGVGKAVGALAHEAMHVAGVADEAAAECYGSQLTAATALALGTEAGYAARVHELNLQYNSEYFTDGMYHSPECHEGGALDLDLPHAIDG